MPHVSVNEIKKKLPAMLRNDTTLKPLLGSTATDPRVYHYYQPEAVIDDRQKAYITYAQLAFPEMTQSVGEPVFSLAVWGLNQETIEAVGERLVTLLHETPLTTLTGKPLWATKVGERDSFQENTKFAGKTYQFRFGFSRITIT